ncbi:MAG: hypothetical protein ALAOOOJD_03755 [bacterium]|nr:hypothetical protein [bacterium]
MTDQFTELAELFVLGALDEQETQQLVKHLATGCAACRRAVAAARPIAGLLPYMAPQNEPPPELKQRLLNTIRVEAKIVKRRAHSEKDETAPSTPATIRALPPRTFFQRAQGPLAWAAIFLLLAVGYGYISQRGLLRQLQAQLEERNAYIKLMEFEMGRQQAVIEKIKASKASRLLLVDLQGTEAGNIKVLLDPQTAGGSFIAYNLPPLTDEHDYQLWFLKGDQPFDAGVFHVNEKGEYIGDIQHLPETLAGISAFAITREPKGGRPTPTMPIYWSGAVQGA